MLTKEQQATDELEFINDEQTRGTGWESNKDDENPKQLPWPEENESKE